MTKEIIFVLLLPPLIFEAALALRWNELRREVVPLSMLATLGVVVSAAVVFLGMHHFVGCDWRPALLFAILISAADPVSVIATLKESRVGGRPRMRVEGESLFNDGVAEALFVVAIAATSGSPPSAPGAVGSFLMVAVGGLLCGALVGGAALIGMGRTSDHLVEITFTSSPPTARSSSRSMWASPASSRRSSPG